MAKRNPSTPKGKSPAFQFYALEFIGDAKQAAMTLPEAGAYIRLMAFEWAEQGKGIPDNPRVCARLISVDAESISEVWPAVRACFIDGPTEGMMQHPRLARERAKQRKYSRSMQLNGRKGGKPRLSAAIPESKPIESRLKADRSSSSSSSSSSYEVQDPARARGVFDGRKHHRNTAYNPTYSAMKAWMAECHELHGDGCKNQREHVAKLERAEAS